jgi:MFS family permease
MSIQDQTNLPREKLWTRNFVLICFSNLASFISLQILLPTIPVYVDFLGGKKSDVGLVFGFFTISAVLIRPLVGKGLDIWGRRSIYFLGLGVFALSCLVYQWAQTVMILLVIRFIHGFGWGASSTAAATVVSDLIPEQRLGEGMGYFGLTSTVSMAVAPALGLYIIGWFNFNVLFISAALLAVVALIFGALIHYQQAPAGQVSSQVVFIEKSTLRPSLTIFFFATSYGSLISFLVLYAAQKGIENIGIFFTVFAIVIAVIRPIAGILLDRKGYDVVVIPGTIAIFAAMLVLSRAEQLWMFLWVAVLYGIGFGSVQPSMQAMAVNNIPFHRRGAANGTFFSAFDLGIALGAVFGGMISEAVGYADMFMLASVPVGLSLVFYWVLGRKGKEKEAVKLRHSVK